jgi:hypothetical protein
MSNNLRSHQEEIYHPPFASLQETSFDFTNFPTNSSAIAALDLASQSITNNSDIKMCTLNQMDYLNSIIGNTIGAGVALSAAFGALIGGCSGCYYSCPDDNSLCTNASYYIVQIPKASLGDGTVFAVAGALFGMIVSATGMGFAMAGTQIFGTEYEFPC